MSEDTPIAKTLKEILHTQSFDKLSSFTDQEGWGTLTCDERTLLAKLFVMAAENDLKRATSEELIGSAKKLFYLASTLAPEDAQIWYKRGLSFATQEQAELLEESSLCLEKTTLLDPTFFDGWYAWANVLIRRGITARDPLFFTQAEEKFKTAQGLLSEPEKHIEFYWHYGLCYFMIGRYSGEAGDTHQAISFYRKAKEQGLTRPHFYNDFANALVELSLLINSQDLMYEAIELYLYSLDSKETQDDNSRDVAVRNCNLGACYQYLFEVHHEETYFKQAQECFQEATKLQPDFGNAWAFWGYLLLYAAKLWQDVHLLEGCLEKLSNLSNFADDKPLVLSRMSEAFSLYGGNEEDLKFLTDAQEIAEAATLEGPNDPYPWAALALANLELGRYFSEAMYYHLAVENAERAIALNQKIGMSWHVLAVAKFSLGEFEEDMDLLQKLLFESSAAFGLAAKTDVGRFGYMWNDWGIALLNLADVSHERKYVLEAIEKFEQGILLHEQVNPIWLINYASALDFWGDISDDESYYEKAIEVLEHGLSLDASNTLARYHLGLTLCHLGELAGDIAHLHRGIGELQVVLQEDREDDAAWADIGMAYMHVADLTQETQDPEVKNSLYNLAEQHFLQAVSLGNQQIYYSLACLYSLQENGPEAHHFLVKAYEAETLPPLSEVLQDRWLDYLRSTPNFQQFLQNVNDTE